MDATLAEVDTTLLRVALLAEHLRADPDAHVRRTVEELRAAFAARAPIEPAVARLRESLEMLRGTNHDGARREFWRRAPTLEYLGSVIDQELLPGLRRLGFEV